jgi:hypothetical protein
MERANEPFKMAEITETNQTYVSKMFIKKDKLMKTLEQIEIRDILAIDQFTILPSRNHQA